MSEFHDNYPQYELMAHHNEEAGAEKRKKLWKVFWILLVITIAELLVGFYNHHFPALFLKAFFIGFTIIKAYFIVMAFMHLGDEKKSFKRIVIGPFTVFIIYLIIICLIEGVYSEKHKAHPPDFPTNSATHPE